MWDFVGYKFWEWKLFRVLIVGLWVKFGANPFKNGRVMFSKWRPLPSWIYFRCPFLSFGRLLIVAVDVPIKFHICTWIYGWLIKLCHKIENGGCRYHELLFSNNGPPTNSPSVSEVCAKISFQSHYYFLRYGHLKILQIWLKRLFPPPKFAFWGFCPYRLFLVIETQKALPSAKPRHMSHTHRALKSVQLFLL